MIIGNLHICHIWAN